MEFSLGNNKEEAKAEYPLAICPNCQAVQREPILDDRLRTMNLKCHSCKEKFCSYCGGDRHIVMSCRKPLPSKSAIIGDQRV